MATKVFIADDHKIVCDGLKMILEHHPNLKVVGEAGNGIETINQCDKLAPDVVIVDIGIPMLNGIEVTRNILKRNPKTKVVILSMYGDEQTVMAAIKAGARGYILKEDASEEVVKAIQQVVEGRAYFSGQISSILVAELQKKEPPPDNMGALSDLLTSQEKKVLQLIAEGNTSKDIAKILFISTQTVRSHRKNIMTKLSIHNVAGLTQFALKKGLTGR